MHPSVHGQYSPGYQQTIAFINKTLGFANDALPHVTCHIYLASNQTKNQNHLTMNKAELIDKIATDAGLSKADAKRALDAFVSATTEELKKKDGRVALVGFGSFTVAKRAARTGRNPKNGDSINIEAKNVVRFKTGNELADAIN